MRDMATTLGEEWLTWLVIFTRREARWQSSNIWRADIGRMRKHNFHCSIKMEGVTEDQRQSFRATKAQTLPHEGLSSQLLVPSIEFIGWAVEGTIFFWSENCPV